MIRFEWDPVKAKSNERKYGVAFDDAMHVFDDPYALFEQDREDERGELRWKPSAPWVRSWCSWSPTRFEKTPRTRSSALSLHAEPPGRSEPIMSKVVRK